MSYAVKEIFLTLQGEGAHAGRAAVFCRFAGCNLWTGREEDRADAVCHFCDTDFVGTDGTLGGRYATPTLSPTPSPRNGAASSATASSSDRRRTAAAGRRRADRRAACARLHIAHRNQRHHRAARRHRLDLRQPESRRRTAVAQGHELNWSIRRPTHRPRISRTSPSSTSRCSRWTAPNVAAQHAHAPSTIACSIRNGGSACRRTRHIGSDRTGIRPMWELTKSFASRPRTR